jgi:hypothetical protein
MTRLLEPSESQLAVWARPRPEPVDLSLPRWARTEYPPSDPCWNERTTHFVMGRSTVNMLRYWDQPLSPGGPMSVESSREVMIANRPTEILTTSEFNGHEQRVQVFWLKGEGHDVEYGVRIVMEHCSPLQVDEVVRGLRIIW